ncbi:tyrosine-type recombinase/integrase [Colwelliaceae bacterium 6471]
MEFNQNIPKKYPPVIPNPYPQGKGAEMSNRFNFTVATLDKLPIPEKNRIEYRDTKIPELVLRVTPTGTKTFSVVKFINGKYIRATLGRYPANAIEQARKKAREKIGIMENGINPTDLKRQERLKKLSIEDLYDNYEDNFKAKIKVGERRQKSLDDLSRIWKLHVKVRLAKLKADEITAGKALRIADKLKADLTAGLYNNAISLLKSLFNLATSHDLISENPFSGISKVNIEARDRFLSKDEIALLFESLTHEKPIYQDVVQMLIYTGQRKGNVYSMEWQELDLERGVWTIPHTKTKTKKVYHVQLATPAVEILKRRLIDHSAQFGESPFVFATNQRGSSTGHLSVKSDNSGYWRRIIERANLDTDNANKRITPHTMRKTLASWQALEGVDLLSISKSLGHSDIATTAKAYAHLSGDTIKAGVQKATDAIQRASTGNNNASPTAKPNLQKQLENAIEGLTEDEQRRILFSLMENKTKTTI